MYEPHAKSSLLRGILWKPGLLSSMLLEKLSFISNHRRDTLIWIKVIPKHGEYLSSLGFESNNKGKWNIHRILRRLLLRMRMSLNRYDENKFSPLTTSLHNKTSCTEWSPTSDHCVSARGILKIIVSICRVSGGKHWGLVFVFTNDGKKLILWKRNIWNQSR